MLTNRKQKLIPRSLTANQTVCARKWQTTSTGIVIYVLFKRSLYSSHQSRHSEVPWNSLAALWALLYCTVSNEGALNGSVTKRKNSKQKKTAAPWWIFRVYCTKARSKVRLNCATWCTIAQVPLLPPIDLTPREETPQEEHWRKERARAKRNYCGHGKQVSKCKVCRRSK